jgi:hypothetical protein
MAVVWISGVLVAVGEGSDVGLPVAVGEAAVVGGDVGSGVKVVVAVGAGVEVAVGAAVAVSVAVGGMEVGVVVGKDVAALLQPVSRPTLMTKSAYMSVREHFRKDDMMTPNLV